MTGDVAELPIESINASVFCGIGVSERLLLAS